MRTRLLSVGKYVVYPFFYVVCLVVGIYASFPWERLQDRIEAEFAKTQATKGKDAWRLDLGSLDGYWLSGVEITGAKVVIPADDDDDAKGTGATPSPRGTLAKTAGKRGPGGAEPGDAAGEGKDAAEKAEAKPKKPKDSVILIEHAHARVKLLPLLIGRVRIDFGAEVFGGEVRGTVPLGGGDLAIEFENFDLGHIAPLSNLASVPMKGIASGKLELTSQGKWSKSAGSFTLTVTDMVMGDGKAKFRNLATLPPAALGTFEIEGKAEAGTLKIEKFGATGRDLEIVGEGTIKLREPWDASVADLWVRFGFSDDYKNKDDKTKALFVDDPPFPALISQDRKLKRAKRPDGMWGFHVHGKLGRLRYDPTTKDGPKGKAAAKKDPAKAGEEEEDDASATPAKPAKRPSSAPPTRPASPLRTAAPTQPDGQPDVADRGTPAGPPEPPAAEPEPSPVQDQQPDVQPDQAPPPQEEPAPH
jgi:type II secretion system protein N